MIAAPAQSEPRAVQTIANSPVDKTVKSPQKTGQVRQNSSGQVARALRNPVRARARDGLPRRRSLTAMAILGSVVQTSQKVHRVGAAGDRTLGHFTAALRRP